MRRKTVQPSVSGLHHPAACPETGPFFNGFRLFATTADVSGEAELFQGASHLIVVVTLVQAHALGMLWAGFRPGHRQAVHRDPHQFHVMAVGPVHRQAYGIARHFREQAAFDSPFALVGGVGAGSPPPRGALVMAPSMLS